MTIPIQQQFVEFIIAMGKRSHESTDLNPKKKSKSDKPPKDKKEKKEKKEKKDKTVSEPQDNVTESTEKTSYTEASALSALPQSEIDTYLKEKVIKFTDPTADAPALRPLISFDYLPPSDSDLYAPLKSFPAPTPIQAATWPLLFAGRDVIGIAETGSGKTLAFGLPCLRKLTESRKARSLIILLLSLSHLHVSWQCKSTISLSSSLKLPRPA